MFQFVQHSADPTANPSFFQYSNCSPDIVSLTSEEHNYIYIHFLVQCMEEIFSP